MKIFNYSDKPVVINGVDINDHLIHIDNSILKSNITHNGNSFITHHNEERNIIYTITKNPAQTNYQYRSDVFSVPDVWLWVSIFITFFGFYFLIQNTTKIKIILNGFR